MTVLSNILSAVGASGQVALLILLLRGSFRNYIPLFIYSLVELIASGVNLYFIQQYGFQSPQYRVSYYITEEVLLVLLFLMVIALTAQALADSPAKAKVSKILAIIAAVVVSLPFVVVSGHLDSRRWFDGTVQIYNFGAAIMNLGLWSALIMRKTRDSQLLTVSAGLGLAVAGAAIAWGTRKFTAPGGVTHDMANLFIQILFFARMLIWCWAFRPQHQQPPANRVGVPNSPPSPYLG